MHTHAHTHTQFQIIQTSLLALSNKHCCFFFNILFIYFIERGREGERGRETSTCGCLSCGLHSGPGLSPRHMPWLGIEPATLWLSSRHSIHWATPARQHCCFNQLSKHRSRGQQTFSGKGHIQNSLASMGLHSLCEWQGSSAAVQESSHVCIWWSEYGCVGIELYLYK